MAIDPKKVLLIRNTNSAVSSYCAAVSDWYATARSLTGSSSSDYFWLGCDFGTSSTLTTASKLATTGSGYPVIDGSSPMMCNAQSSKITLDQTSKSILQAIKDVINTYDIHAIFLLPGTPILLDVSATTYPQYMEVFLAALGHTSNVVNFSGQTQKDLSGSPGILLTDGTGSGFSRKKPNKQLSRLGGGAYDIYCGRVRGSTSNITTALAEVTTIVNNAKAAEAQNSFNKMHILGGTAYIFSGGILSSTATNYLGYDMGLTNLGYIANGESGVGYAEVDLWPRRPAWKGDPLAEMVYSSGRQVVQANGGGKITPFCLISPRIEPYASVSFDAARLEFQPGGFGYAWMSAAGALSSYVLAKGGSLGFGVGGEPFSNNLPDSDALLYMLYLGNCGAEAVYRANQYWRYTGTSVRDLANGATTNTSSKLTSAHGDPLYTPYKLYGPKIMQVGA